MITLDIAMYSYQSGFILSKRVKAEQSIRALWMDVRLIMRITVMKTSIIKYNALAGQQQLV